MNSSFLPLLLLLPYPITASFGITTIVNCLNDSELKFLGAPIDEYIEAATRHGVRVLRLPVIEGAAPDSIEEIEVILVEMEKVLSGGKNVLCHCRGGKS